MSSKRKVKFLCEHDELELEKRVNYYMDNFKVAQIQYSAFSIASYEKYSVMIIYLDESKEKE